MASSAHVLMISMLLSAATCYQKSFPWPSLRNRELLQALAPVCKTKYLLTTCRPSRRCSSGNICVDTTYQPCCQRSQTECPTTAQLGFKCYVKTPTSWCRQNSDCRGKMCCPTGCNYNVCI
ncbi:hypothetical protein V3C99_014410 [Haemonchus contortus]